MKKILGLVFVILMAFSIGYLVKDQIPTFAQETKVTDGDIDNTNFGELDQITINENTDSENKEQAISGLEEQITNLIDQKDHLETQFAQLTSELDETIDQLDTAQQETQLQSKQINNLKEEIQELEAEIQRNTETITFLNNRRDELETELDDLRNTNYQQIQEIENLEADNKKILDIRVTQHYEWVYGDWLWKDRY